LHQLHCCSRQLLLQQGTCTMREGHSQTA
jgi:hypothetical protein